MVWLIFSGSAAVIALAAMQLAKYGDAIAARTKLGGISVGTLLLAGATSLPELLTTISSLNQEVPNLAAGNISGGNMFNVFVLALLDMLFRQARILRRVIVAGGIFRLQRKCGGADRLVAIFAVTRPERAGRAQCRPR